MTSLRGTFWLLVSIILAVLFPAVVLIAVNPSPLLAATASAQDGSSASMSQAIKNAVEKSQTNSADSANKKCEDYAYPTKCGEIDKATGKNGGEGCSCTTTVPDGRTIKGHCTYDTDAKKGVCHADTIVGSGNGTANDAGAGTPTSGGTAPVSNPTGGSTGGLQGASSQSPVEVGGVNGGSGVTGAFTPGSSSGAPSPTPSSGGSSPISGIGGIAGGSNGGFSGLPVSSGANTSLLQPTGMNWSYLAQYANNLRGQAPVTAPRIDNLIYYYPAPVPAQQNNSSGFSSTLVVVQNEPFYSPVGSYGNFFGVLGQAGDAVVSGISSIYESLAGIAQPESTVPAQESSDTSVSILQTEIGTDTETTSDQPETSTAAPTTSQNALPHEPNVQVQLAVAKVQDSLRALNAKLAARAKNEQASSTTTPKTNTSSAASSSAPREELPEKVTAALKSAEDRVTELQTQLEQGKSELKTSNEKVQQLTDELNALNQRIQAVSQAIDDPSVSEADEENLITALITNIQLSLADAEARLESAVSEEKPRTVGDVVFKSLGGGGSGVADMLAELNQLFANLFQAIFRTLFG